jgi:putative serine protease PepD
VWLQYDPWSAPAQPLTHPGEPAVHKRRRGPLLIGAVVLALVAGGTGGVIGAYIERNGGISQIELPQAGRESGDRAPDSVAGIAASALPSVVTLHVSGGDEQGTGTGFVLDRQGHILTNNHVVDPAGSSGDITITFSSGESARATLVGKDSGYDLAVVKVSGVSGLKPLPLGNSDNVQVGDPVVAIGAPFDLQNTVTSGIISAKERPITAGGEKGDGSDISYVDALQTDAPINPGNSGGPLVDAKARVIGINSAIRAADSTGAEGGQAGSIGLGFAIPINQGKRVAEELINTGRATHPVIGVSLDMKFTGDGARVGEKGKDDAPAVTPGGPAAKAGVRPGDVITKVDGQRVHSGEELIVKIRAHRPGDRLELTLERGGTVRTLTLTLGSADSS